MDAEGWPLPALSLEPLDRRPMAIGLTKRQAVVLDYRDWERFRHWLWFCTTPGKSGYAVRSARKEDKEAFNAEGLIWLHLEILRRWRGPMPEPGMIGDHQNGCRLDCRLQNLRWATKLQNARNVHGIYHRQLELKI